MPNKRTNVRLAARAIRMSFHLLNPLPPLASALALRIWGTPPRARIRPAQAELLSQAERLDFDAGGSRIAAYGWGSGPPVLLVHGWGGHAGQLTPFVPALVAAGYRAVFLAPATSMDAAAQRFARMVGLAQPGLERMCRKFEQRLGVPWRELEMRRDAPRIRSEVLLIHDRGDRDVPYAECIELHAALPRAELVLTEGLGHHGLLWDADVVREVVGFVTDRRSLRHVGG